MESLLSKLALGSQNIAEEGVVFVATPLGWSKTLSSLLD